MQIRAAGVNFMDVLIRRGDYPQPPELPFTPGGEVAGELDGQRVMALPRTGGYAEAVAADWVVPLPDQATFAEGASFLLTFLTAYIPLTRQVVLRDGAREYVMHFVARSGSGHAAYVVCERELWRDR